jgi:uncharacterized damage-inducible protein DinB
MSARAEDLAANLTHATDELIAMVEACSDARWAEKNAYGEWTVAATAHHAAASLPSTSAIVRMLAAGEPLPPISFEQINAQNAVDAGEFAQCSRAETLALLRMNANAAAEFVRGLSTAELDRSAALAFLGGRETSAAELTDMLVIGHVKGHFASILTTA